MTTPHGVRHVSVATALFIATLSLTACEAPYVEEEAEALVAQFSAVEAVSSASVTYDDMGGWESDEVAYRVDIEPGADADAVAQVAAAVYETVSDDDDVNEAAVSATLHVGDDRLTLRIFESEAPTERVTEVVAALVPELEKGRTLIEVDTSTREADEAFNITGSQVLGPEATRDEVRQSRSGWRSLIDRLGDGGVSVQNAPRSS